MANNKRFTNNEKYQKHLDVDQRIQLQKIITEHRYKYTLKIIAEMLCKDPTTISKEVKKNRVVANRPIYTRYSAMNCICINMKECKKNDICGKICKDNVCKTCKECYRICPDFKEQICPSLTKFPWVCNGCKKRIDCHLNKYLYYSDISQKHYEERLHESREGINMTECDLKRLDDLVSPLIKKGQSLEHIYATHEEEMPCSIRTVYSLIHNQYIGVKNIDLRRKVKYKPRVARKPLKSMNNIAKIGRTYEDYIEYIKLNDEVNTVQMDTVEGVKGESLLLTIHFTTIHFMIAFKIPNKRPESVINVFNRIQDIIGIEEFKRIFPIILTDNGVEFYKPELIEFDSITNEQRTKLFYCHPMASWEKAHIEKNHQYIRYFISHGNSFNLIHQSNISLMMSHINSTKRKSIDKFSPYDLALVVLGKEILDAFKVDRIDPDDVILSPSLFR